ncbi:MAG: helix-turn-helix domain-containing protein [Archaeoglobaceae archaeon]|nr:helix-turn-helix domain-containing protein [Archaeoglobaceae archaeon]
MNDRKITFLSTLLELDEVEAKILDVLMISPSSITQISQKLQIKRVKVYKALSKLKKKGFVESTLGVYFLKPHKVEEVLLKKRETIKKTLEALKELETILCTPTPQWGDKND